MIIRAICIIPLLIALALITKKYLIKPYGYVTINFTVEEIVPLKKGDREI